MHAASECLYFEFIRLFTVFLMVLLRFSPRNLVDIGLVTLLKVDVVVLQIPLIRRLHYIDEGGGNYYWHARTRVPLHTCTVSQCLSAFSSIILTVVGVTYAD